MPLIQLCIDVTTIPEAVAVAEMGLRAGVDWLELGTPLIAWEGINNLSGFTSRFPDAVKFLDAKVMDASARYVYSAADLGIQMVCLCASASDATFRAAIATGKQRGVRIVGDLYAVPDPIARARQLMALDVDAIYLHYGYDQLTESPAGNPTIAQVAELKALTDLPIGVVVADAQAAEQAARARADVLLVSHPYLVGADVEQRLADLIRTARAADGG